MIDFSAEYYGGTNFNEIGNVTVLCTIRSRMLKLTFTFLIREGITCDDSKSTPLN
jgi:hypothetical protein